MLIDTKLEVKRSILKIFLIITVFVRRNQLLGEMYGFDVVGFSRFYVHVFGIERITESRHMVEKLGVCGIRLRCKLLEVSVRCPEAA